jgi:hypothetical protein
LGADVVKVNPKFNLLLSGAIIIALASFAFAADPQKDDPLLQEKDSYSIEWAGSSNQVFLDPKTGAYSADGFVPVKIDFMADGKALVDVSAINRVMDAGSNPVLPPPSGSVGASYNPGNSGMVSESSHIPSISAPTVWVYTPPTPAIPRNISSITIMLPKAQIILGSDFIKRAPDRFLAAALTNVISQIVMSSPSINIPGNSAPGMPESSLIAVVTTRGIAIYAPANPGIRTDMQANASMAPSVQMISGNDYMKLAGAGFIGISVGELQATAPLGNGISIAALHSGSGRLPGYMSNGPDSSFITVAITPTTAIYIPSDLNNPADAPQVNRPLAVPHSASFAIMPEIASSTPLVNEDVQEGSILIETPEIKATVPDVDTAQLPDSIFIAVAITPDGAIYMPDPQAITLAKKPAMPDQKTKNLMPEMTISAPVWNDNKAGLPDAVPSIPDAQIMLEADIVKIANDSTISIDTKDIKATAPAEAEDTIQTPDSANIAVAITPEGMVYMPKPQTITLAAKPAVDKPKADLKPIVWSAPEKAPETTKVSTKTVEVKVLVSRAKKAIIAKIMAFKAKQTIAVKKFAKMVAVQARDITKKTIAKYIKFVKMSGNRTAAHINKLIKGLIQALKNFGPNEEIPAIILDRNNLPAAAADRRIDPLGPPLQKIRINELGQDQVPFGARISHNSENRITNLNIYFVDIIKKNAVNYSHTGLSPPQTVSAHSTLLLSASKESAFLDFSFVFSFYISNKTISPSLLNAIAFNPKAGDFCLFNNLFKKGGSHV